MATLGYNAIASEGGLFLSYQLQFPGLDLDGQQTPNDPSDDVISIQFRYGDPGTNGPHVLNVFGEVKGLVREDDAEMVVVPGDAYLQGKWNDQDEVLTGAGGGRAPEDSVKLSSVVDDLFAGRIYLQVATKAYPSGELRGQILLPPPLILPSRLNDGLFQLTINHQPLREYRIEHSDDFVGWTTLTNIYALQSLVRTVDFGAASAGMRFYRIAQFVIVPLHIDVHPLSQVVNVGEGVALSVAVSGSEPLAYQWQRNGVPVLGATNSTLMLANLTAGQAGSYTVTVTNPAGSETSNPAVLTIDP